MKKFTLLLAVLTVCMYSFAQTFVSTTPANKNVVLEEYTGTNCGYCPDGHRIAQQLMAANPGRFFAINIHQGGYAGSNPNYKTQWGDALAAQYNISSYPSGTLNRHTFGSSAVVEKSTWTRYTDTIKRKPSPVNVAAQSTIDWNTRQLTVVVEVYYTANATNSTNKLNIALLQDSILGPQVGASNYNPDMMVGNQYMHMHMLRDFVTGQWGADIPTTTAGTFFTQTFTYNIPYHVKNVPIKIDDVEVFVYVAEGHNEILTGDKSSMNIINHFPLHPVLSQVNIINSIVCDNNSGAYFTIESTGTGSDTIQSLEIEYTIAGGTPQTILWNAREIYQNNSDTIRIPDFTITPNIDQEVTAKITRINGIDFTAPTNSNILIKKIANGGGYMTLKLVTDKYASETTFKVFRPDGSVLLQGGPWANANNTTTRLFAIKPAEIGCYRLEVYDSFGDGINSGYGVGGFQVIKYDNSVILNDDGKFGKMSRYMINVDEVSGIEETISTNDVKVYPNPTDGVTNVAINLVNDAKVNATVYNIYGQLVQVLNDSNLSQGANNLTFNASSLSSGIYLVKVTIDNETFTKKVTVR